MPIGMLQRSSEATREAPAGGGSGLQMEISSEATREVPAGGGSGGGRTRP